MKHIDRPIVQIRYVAKVSKQTSVAENVVVEVMITDRRIHVRKIFEWSSVHPTAKHIEYVMSALNLQQACAVLREASL